MGGPMLAGTPLQTKAVITSWPGKSADTPDKERSPSALECPPRNEARWPAPPTRTCSECRTRRPCHPSRTASPAVPEPIQIRAQQGVASACRHS